MQPMSTAPRDGTHFLAYLYHEPDSDGRGEHGEWLEIWYKQFRDPVFGGMAMCWHAGDDFDAHQSERGCGDSHYGEAVPLCWLPLPVLTKAQRSSLLLERRADVDTFVIDRRER